MVVDSRGGALVVTVWPQCRVSYFLGSAGADLASITACFFLLLASDLVCFCLAFFFADFGFLSPII
jgi:hypothetical protein